MTTMPRPALAATGASRLEATEAVGSPAPSPHNLASPPPLPQNLASPAPLPQNVASGIDLPHLVATRERDQAHVTPGGASRVELPRNVAPRAHLPHLVASRERDQAHVPPGGASRIDLPQDVASRAHLPQHVASRGNKRPGTRRARGMRRVGSALAAAVLALGAGLFGAATPASAEARVAIAVEGSTATDAAGLPLLSPDAPSTLTVTGSGFQSVQGGFGGIYVLFGWVDPAGSWQPSLGGATGTSYRYAMDDETSPAGYQQFVAFPGGATEASASSGVIAADGSWSATVAVQGPVFETFDRENNPVQVDCLATQCGVITIGAHGVANPTNETFTPVAFGSIAPTPTPEPATATAAPGPAVGAGESTGTAVPLDDVAAATGSSDLAPALVGVAIGVVVAAVIATVVVVSVRRRRHAASPASKE